MPAIRTLAALMLVAGVGGCAPSDGPPLIVKPTFELLGEELLRLGRHEEATAAFQRAAERAPGRAAAVRGLARSRTSAR